MTTSAVIALTPDALNVLFPEGSQARVELQRASLDLAARHFAKHALGDEAKAFLKQVIQQVNDVNMTAIHDELKAHFGPDALGFGRQRFVLNQDMKDRIREAAQSEVRVIIRQEIDSAMKVETDRLKEIADPIARNAVYQILKTEIVSVTQQELEARVTTLKSSLKAS